MEKKNMNAQQIDDYLNRRSGIFRYLRAIQ